MADISRYLQAIEDAIYGEEVRDSIHDAIALINSVCEQTLTTGTDVTSQSSSIEGYYDGSLYINTETDDLWLCDGTKWVWQANLTGNGIDHISKTGTGGDHNLVDTYTIYFTYGNTTTFTVTNGKTAYQSAVDGGYDESEANFESDLANFKVYAEEASDSASAADSSAEDSEAYAVGKRDGVDVGSSDPTYHNNSKYYSEQAASSASTASTKASEASTSATNAANSASTASTKASEASSSATSASGSATTASTKAGEASSSASDAASSASTATTKASEASTSAQNAASSASTASTKAGEASDSATAAAGSASTASTKAGEASTSASNANASALKAEGYAVGKQNGIDVESGSDYYQNNAKYYSDQANSSASTASTKAGEASTSAQNAASSASTASTKADEAATSASNASGSATTASTKAGEASTSASNASSSATSAASSASDSEAFGAGTRNGQPVGSSDPAYHNNAKYYSEQAAGTTFSGLQDVSINDQTLTNGQVPKYNSSTQKWENGNIDFSPYYGTGDTAETALADADYVPFYDTSASAKRKTLWSNIKSVLKTYFDTLYSTVKTRGTPTSGGTALSLVNTGDMYTWNAKQNAPTVLTATLATPNTQVTFTNAAITANARVQVFTNVPGLNFESMDASTANTIVLTYEAQNTNVNVQLVIW